MKKDKKKHLVLSKEAIRALVSDRLTLVIGGIQIPRTKQEC